MAEEIIQKLAVIKKYHPSFITKEYSINDDFDYLKVEYMLILDQINNKIENDSFDLIKNIIINSESTNVILFLAISQYLITGDDEIKYNYRYNRLKADPVCYDKIKMIKIDVNMFN